MCNSSPEVFTFVSAHPVTIVNITTQLDLSYRLLSFLTIVKNTILPRFFKLQLSLSDLVAEINRPKVVFLVLILGPEVLGNP